METEIIIKNGKVVTEEETLKCDILINAAGVIAAIEPNINPTLGQHVIDATDLVIFPGGIDGHVHLNYHMGDIYTTDDFATGSAAALAGGTTTIIDFVEPEPGEDAILAIKRRKEEARKAVCDYTFHYILTEEYRNQIDKIDEIFAEGIGSFKAYTTYDNLTLNAGNLYDIMKQIDGRATLMVHAEDKDMISVLQEKYPEPDIMNIYRTRDNLVEALSITELALLQKKTGTKVCIAHTSTQEALLINRKEKENRVYLETCPHYLELTKDIYNTPEGKRFTMNPPLKQEKDREALWDGIVNGEVDLISTDHCPFASDIKDMATDYRTCACGIGGIQTRFQYMFTQAVVKRGLSYEAFAKIIATNCAKIYGLYPRKGSIHIGADADLVLFNPNQKHVYTLADSFSACDYDMLEQKEFIGAVEKVFLRGRIAYESGQVYPAAGTFIECAK